MNVSIAGGGKSSPGRERNRQPNSRVYVGTDLILSDGGVGNGEGRNCGAGVNTVTSSRLVVSKPKTSSDRTIWKAVSLKSSIATTSTRRLSVVELHTGRLAGSEVLARRHHPQNGIILPANFISLTEEHGIIGELMRQIPRKAFLSAPALPAPLALSVNASPTQQHDPSLVGQIRNAANSAEFPMDRLIVEITESALAEDLEQAMRFARELKEMGCKLALDDFGTGYSSLRQLSPFRSMN